MANIVQPYLLIYITVYYQESMNPEFLLDPTPHIAPDFFLCNLTTHIVRSRERAIAINHLDSTIIARKTSCLVFAPNRPSGGRK